MLERVCYRVVTFGEAVQGLAADLEARLHALPYKQRGYALAAPQIGVSQAVTFIDCEGQKLIMVNPTLMHLGRKIRVTEGCLSIPGFFHTIERRHSVTVLYQDEHGASQVLKTKGLLAQVVQHECDHLRGVLMLEYVQERQARRRAKRGMEALPQ